MRNQVTVFLLFVAMAAGCRDKSMDDPAIKEISVAHAQADLETLSDILKSAHPSLSLYISKERFFNLIDSMKQSIKAPVELGELFTKVNFIVNEIGCSHTSATLPAYVYDTLQDRAYFFPYPVKWVEDKLLVNVAGYDLPEGTEIKNINNQPVKKLLKNLAIYNSVEGYHRNTQLNLAGDDFSFEYYLQYGKKDVFTLVIKDTLGMQKIVEEKSVTLSEWNSRNSDAKYYYDRTEVDYDLAFNDEQQWAYLKLSTFHFDGEQRQTAFANFCSNSFELLQRKKHIKSLIIDLRENHGGKLYNCFLLYSYLATQPFNEYAAVSSKIRKVPYETYLDTNFIYNDETDINDRLEEEFSSKMSNHFFYMPDSLVSVWEPDSLRFKGNVYVITGSSVVSSASYFATMVKNSGRGLVIGEETTGGSSSGNGFNSLKYILPHSGISLEFPYAHITYSFGDEKNAGNGLKPDYYVPDSYESFKKNDDRQFSFIVDSLILKKKSAVIQ